MEIRIERAREHNLQNVSLSIGPGITTVTGISGSGKSSLAFDTLYHEAYRRFLEIYAGGSRLRLTPADVDRISGLIPAVAVAQDKLNRNPGSLVATATGMHPFLRLLFANYGTRVCPNCGAAAVEKSDDEIIARLANLAESNSVTVSAPLVHRSAGTHATLRSLLHQRFPDDEIAVDPGTGDIDLVTARLPAGASATGVRQAVEAAANLGTLFVRATIAGTGEGDTGSAVWSRDRVCFECGVWYDELRPSVFYRGCPYCQGKGCERCDGSGRHPDGLSVTWNELGFHEMLSLSATDFAGLLTRSLSGTGGPGVTRLCTELLKRAQALCDLGLGYLSLDRPSPSLSRGESQRLRLSVCLTSKLELLHVLDEPTIGLHPVDTGTLFGALRRLSGPVVVVEHDRGAAALSDRCVDMGPGAGAKGGVVVFEGPPEELWKSQTITGRCFRQSESPAPGENEESPGKAATGSRDTEWISVQGARANNLRGIDVRFPIGRMSVVTGVSGSGKSSLVHAVIGESLSGGEPSNCTQIDAPVRNCVVVDQGPIGKNPRSNPATYTKLSDVIRDVFAERTGLDRSAFSFNRSEGACPHCNGIGAEELAMRFLPSIWLECPQCAGRRFSEVVLEQRVEIGGELLSVADVYEHRIDDIALGLIAASGGRSRRAESILHALQDIGLGYLTLGQPSPTLSGGEAQRVKLAKYLGKKDLSSDLLILDEPSTGLHSADVVGLVTILSRLRDAGCTIIVVEHNLDVVRACDWVVDLGPGAGPEGGSVVYQGSVDGLVEADGSVTAQALATDRVTPQAGTSQMAPREGEGDESSDRISIRGASLHNLREVDVDIPARSLTVVTGVSGSGKSSLVSGELESAARRRFLETMSMYERQAVTEADGAGDTEISGLGVTIAIGTQRGRYDPRSTIGSASEVVHKISALFAFCKTRYCESCGEQMTRVEQWRCSSCGATAPILSSGSFYRSNYRSACTTCHGVGTTTVPDPDKLIIAPEKPLCGGAMYSPGFFPKGYLCKPYNGGYYVVQALAAKYGFDPSTTPWDQMSAEARQAFLFGDDEELVVHYESKNGRQSTRRQSYPGFYGWIGDWDIGGTYSNQRQCRACDGTGLREGPLAVRYGGKNIHELCEMSLGELSDHLQSHPPDSELCSQGVDLVAAAYSTAVDRLAFLVRTGLGYLHLNRLDATLSAGESQRVRLARLLGSGLSRLTVLLDEPSRGMHPCEVEALIGVLQTLRDEGNTVVVVEHDTDIIRAADWVITMGPGPGAEGGRVVFSGPSGPDGEQVAYSRSPRRAARGWMEIKGASENNLADIDVAIPRGVLTGICGVSGSGKSTLIVDTISRIVAPRRHTTSVAYEPLAPGAYDSVLNMPERAAVIDQSRAGVVTPATFLSLDRPLARLYAGSEAAASLGLSADAFRRDCDACGGSGVVTVDMGFLPDVHLRCETCDGTGYRPEVRSVRVEGVTIAEASKMTLSQIRGLFLSEPTIAGRIDVVVSLGLGYLVFHQPGVSLSGGEAQRLKIARELFKRRADLYILDEPTVGQHLSDVARLMEVLGAVVDDGASVIVVEHNPHALALCDWLIELGPGGGPAGGRVVAAGTPEQVAEGRSATGPYVKQVLEGL